MAFYYPSLYLTYLSSFYHTQSLTFWKTDLVTGTWDLFASCGLFSVPSKKPQLTSEMPRLLKRLVDGNMTYNKLYNCTPIKLLFERPLQQIVFSVIIKIKTWLSLSPNIPLQAEIMKIRLTIFRKFWHFE